MEKIMMTRQEIEMLLERKWIGKTVIYDSPEYDRSTKQFKQIAGRMQRLSIEDHTGELMVVFMIDRNRYTCDLQYFAENLKLANGNTSGTNPGNGRGNG